MRLSDDEFNELLQKRLAPTDEAITEEEPLSEEDAADLAIMRDALGSYKTESLHWAEKRSAMLPPPRHGAAVALWDRAPRWALAGVAAAACAVGAVTLTHIHTPTPAAVATAPTEQILAADNQLLLSVEDALAGSGSTPTAERLGLSPTDFVIGVHDTRKRSRVQSAAD